MNGIRTFLEEALKLRINPEKSAVARPWERKFLGYSVTSHRETRLRIAPAKGMFSVTGWVRNVANNRYKTSVGVTQPTIATTNGVVSGLSTVGTGISDPRTYGVSASVKW
jgi:RNA-directed DNA polymerase